MQLGVMEETLTPAATVSCTEVVPTYRVFGELTD